MVAFDSVHRRSDGTTFPVEIRLRSFQVGTERRMLAAARDVTERKQAERIVYESEQRYRVLADCAQVVLWEADPTTFCFTYVSEFAEALLGFPREAWYQPNFWVDHLYPDDRDFAVNFCLQHTKAGQDHRFEYRMVRSDGGIVWVEDVVTIVPEESRYALRGVMVDVTERKETERKMLGALRSKAETLALLDALHADAPVGLALYDTQGRYLRCNEALAAINGIPAAGHIGRTMEEVLPSIWPVAKPMFEEALAGGGPIIDHEFKGETPAQPGVLRYWLVCFYPVKMGEEILGVGALINEVTQQKRAEAALRSSESRHRALVEALPDLMFRFDAAGNIIDYHAPPDAQLLTTPDRFLGRHTREFMPADVVELIEAKRTAALTSSQVQSLEYDLELMPDEIASYEVRMVLYGENEVVAVVRNVTEAKRFEEQMRKLQKVEAVGRLAGGIAHDFNNLLTIVNGYSELLLKKFEPDDPRLSAILAVRDAGRRAAKLVKQLLAFSREQVFRLETLRVDEVVARMEPLIRGLLRNDVVLEFALQAGGAQVRADRGQIEQVVFNLVANARDAMTKNGRLTIRTDIVEAHEPRAAAIGQVPPGRYARLIIIDNGHGMTAEVMSKIFEPFFTTKEVGQGTGLGLPTVDGIVRQSGGFVEIASEVSVGTTVTVLLPVFSAATQIS
ncbi:MAG: PAS domain S-box protein [Pirellulales bacterium]